MNTIVVLFASVIVLTGSGRMDLIQARAVNDTMQECEALAEEIANTWSNVVYRCEPMTERAWVDGGYKQTDYKLCLLEGGNSPLDCLARILTTPR